jgi:hypothetical protein
MIQTKILHTYTTGKKKSNTEFDTSFKSRLLTFIPGQKKK